MLRKLPLFLFILILPALYADSFKDRIYWAVNAGIFFFAADNGDQGADPPAILPSLGFSLAWQFWGPLRLELTEDIYFTNYEYNVQRGYPMACSPENRSAFVLGFVTGLQITGNFHFKNDAITLRAFGGPVADFRVVTLAVGLNHPSDNTGELETDPRLQTNAIRNYFWSNGRMFLFTVGAGVDFKINEKYKLGLDLRVLAPLYRLWTNENIPGIDGWRFGAGIRISPVKP